MSNQQAENKKEYNLAEIVEPLLYWYDLHARILPWRENTEPYRVWVSEIMLQQTRVEAVKPFYERFMDQLPTIQSLALAEEEVILKLWEGLGYYNRVRNLQKAAQLICAEHNGVFPQVYEQILALPGIGEYTAGAISSISFHKPVPAVDGNVLRVITRLTENSQDITSPALKKQMTHQLKEIYPMTRCGDFTQSLMELGATVCTPNGSPKCDDCPLSHLCNARRNGTQMQFPVKAKKAARKQQVMTVLLLCCGDKIAVNKRTSGGLLDGLWEFPNAPTPLTVSGVNEWLALHELQAKHIGKTSPQKHIFTHIEWKMDGYIVQCTGMNKEYTWVTRDILDKEITLPTAFKKFQNYWTEPAQ